MHDLLGGEKIKGKWSEERKEKDCIIQFPLEWSRKMQIKLLISVF